jgi:hypothetical protein
VSIKTRLQQLEAKLARQRLQGSWSPPSYFYQDQADPDLWHEVDMHTDQTITTSQIEALSCRKVLIFTDCYLPGRKNGRKKDFSND